MLVCLTRCSSRPENLNKVGKMATEFTPFASLLGGALIGLSASLLMLGTGRIAGATGILSGALFPSNRSEFTWRAVTIVGMIAAVPILQTLFGIVPNVVPPFGAGQIVFGGLIVGIGVSFASGCTSGHGICGLARLSKRSLIAVMTFMATGFVTVFAIRHMLEAV